MTKRIKVHEEGNVGISFEAGRLLTWGESLVKAWPKGLENEAEELECFGDVRHALSIKHENKIYGNRHFKTREGLKLHFSSRDIRKCRH